MSLTQLGLSPWSTPAEPSGAGQEEERGRPRAESGGMNLVPGRGEVRDTNQGAPSGKHKDKKIKAQKIFICLVLLGQPCTARGRSPGRLRLQPPQSPAIWQMGTESDFISHIPLALCFSPNALLRTNLKTE